MEANIDGTLKTMRADIDGTLKTMRADIDGTLKDMRTDIERHNTAIERNNTTVVNRIHTQSKWIMGMTLGVIVLIIGMAGLFLQVLTSTP